MFRTMTALVVAAASLGATSAAQAQMFVPRASAYAPSSYGDGCGGRFTLAGAHAGVTVLGVDVGASAGLHVGLHDRCGGGQTVVYAPPPAPYAQGGYSQGGYGYGYAQQGYAPPAYGSAGGGYGGEGYAVSESYGYPAPGGYPPPPPCGC